MTLSTVLFKVHATVPNIQACYIN